MGLGFKAGSRIRADKWARVYGFDGVGANQNPSVGLGKAVKGSGPLSGWRGFCKRPSMSKDCKAHG